MTIATRGKNTTQPAPPFHILKTHTQSEMEEKAHTGSNRGFTFSTNTTPGTSSPRSDVLNGNDDARSKKQLKTDNEVHSSTIAVLGNDDLLIEILLRLPVLSLHLFKSVSKHWLSLITSPNFTLSRNKIPKIDPPAGLLIFRTIIQRSMLQMQCDFESFDIRIPSKRSTHFTLGSDAPPGFVRILDSSNGLLLCWMQPDKLYVCNPTIKLFKRLLTNSRVGYVKIAFDPTKSPHYKVIRVKVADVGYCQIETYSSETGNWSVCGDRFPQSYFTLFNSAIYWNDAFHWLITDHGMFTHCNLKFVNEHPVLTKTELPRTFEGKLFESGGSLLLLSRVDIDSRKLNVFEMKNGCSEWSVKYIVNLNDIMMPFPKKWRIDRRVWEIVSGEREEDSFMIIDSLSKVVQYNPMLKTLSTLYEKESTSSFLVLITDEAIQFIPSFAGV